MLSAQGDPTPPRVSRMLFSPHPYHRTLLFWGISALLLFGAHALDRTVWLAVHDSRLAEQARWSDFWRLWRSVGYLPTWLLVVAAMLLHAWPRVKKIGWPVAWHAPLMLLYAVLLNGLLAELLKLTLRRMRPEAADGRYVFRPWLEQTWSSSGLALPSSHAAVAFAAVFMLLRLYPRAWPVWWVMGLGCAMQRVICGAHFVSDVTAAGIIAWLGVAGLWKLDHWRHRQGGTFGA